VRRSRRFVAKHFDCPGQELVALSIVPADSIVPPGQLKACLIENLKRELLPVPKTPS
jgi:hypothetical protein